MKTAELTGVVLDFWVAEAEGYEPVSGKTIPKGDFMWKAPRAISPAVGWMSHKFSQDWALAGPIIERENLCVAPNGRPGSGWHALVKTTGGFLSDEYQGPTPLIAAMRAYVASKFGEEVADMPDRSK
ncbi:MULTISPECIES: phage protein NinX family protein [unclassified Variovorax]|jgi:hypothetical protein|uniref:phage protein NinX family protein n=1 Tax=unclassified Variovorax TaxID=663243 RepID=UPI000F7F7C64|nr:MULTISPECIES: phage protein NinX family protein [unclassified Variovorax]RSZ35322.1 DUF2591 domain-containing protein [Variovorax sp. 553]RSZ35964.1 DUF2591 domain-containing protein [Variovorax sp. 679]